MMFYRARNPAIAYALIPWFVPNDQTLGEIFLELYRRLKENPDETLCMIAQEGDLCHGIIIAYERDDDVFIWQARCRDLFDSLFPDRRMAKEWINTMFGFVTGWARQKGYTKIKTVSPDRSFKRYGFHRNGDEFLVKEL